VSVTDPDQASNQSEYDTGSSRADYIRRIVDAAPPLLPQQCDRLARLMRPNEVAGFEIASLGERMAS
jgi:hypothetical protein